VRAVFLRSLRRDSRRKSIYSSEKSLMIWKVPKLALFLKASSFVAREAKKFQLSKNRFPAVRKSMKFCELCD